MDARGFSLLELVIVMVILAIVTAIALPRIGAGSENAVEITTRESLRRIQGKVDEHKSVHGAFPPKLDGSWFADGQIPPNPMAQGGTQERKVYTSLDKNTTHPTFKYMLDATAWWYNPETGWVRARVIRQSSDEDTVDLYNAVNSASLTDLTQVVDP